ncbi:hypothetical protein ASPVEDRAFT_48929 [Aspergillus versicolor CBS 583.65]|uniref:DUF1754-domain-containing protein n=1 Tax=Aspergillus versicolor CBS 583.65 TaxID=1036611 RepID=A0A1L9P5V8_ASPVE|nr:uncharacterized protein ASPVEDRAFT_48929 [Aspergillus versicolor CBS 583.65]OJI96823.1 hypothetical protein ASPVEDRAFT_48929 [Aspergillus versicolor CBS 583.65]
MDEYSAGGGGKLKLKGAKVSDGRVKKKKSSKKGSSAATAAGAGGAEKEGEKSSEAAAAAAGEEGSSTTTGALPGEEGEEGDGSSTPQSQSQSHAPAKTEAEKRHEEMRKKRVLERLKREGIKTHKERVEELNKYLSRLSEHHDMPKIGPG